MGVHAYIYSSLRFVSLCTSTPAFTFTWWTVLIWATSTKVGWEPQREDRSANWRKRGAVIGWYPAGGKQANVIRKKLPLFLKVSGEYVTITLPPRIIRSLTAGATAYNLAHHSSWNVTYQQLNKILRVRYFQWSIIQISNYKSTDWSLLTDYYSIMQILYFLLFLNRGRLSTAPLCVPVSLLDY